MKDYYSLLGITKDATKTEIKKNYRLLANKYHPDKNSDPNAASKFIVITEAYDVLSNKKRRTDYDAMRWEMLKRTEASNDSYSAYVPPRESTRTRRNKDQQKRSLKYHQEQSQSKRFVMLIMESLMIASRYVAQMIGIVLLVVILISAFNQMSDVFDIGVGKGIVLAALMVLFVYGLFRLIQFVFEELKKDIEAFTVFYKLSSNKASIYTVSTFILVYSVLAVLLKSYF